ncbi:asparagine synthase (glutamine-hydrolyzing) [Magnetospirillum sulfuroxidans]|uniref:asparagine synthase (glutamine-hydrolyzing) n=1 Tax=Magnetospirillum sulfuroxidans TaxID=611300 RepID=A0ABS5IAC8_9PROT|nr:asparagine synthase (glutamine-hydrolyzing) [Magnetospirillum sulfuroxidans]MBR9971362.1 asparagine synthase (glutamine-hydrolyzing) [Magnetospirillum sulfuroxidans]
MCGIAGLLDYGNKLPLPHKRGAVTAMTVDMRHRGPDDGGIWQSDDGVCTLGHRRLSILDLSPAGHQPMLAPDGQALTFNGEIYNYRPLRQQLEAEGWRFASATDTEVLLAGLVLHGPAFIDRLDGMYAFAWWNPITRTVLLGRDRFGEKPLYLYRSGGVIAFASEVRALACLPDFDSRVDAQTLAGYLAFQYFPAGKTIYAAATTLAPGQVAEIGADGEMRVLAQWRFTTAPRQRSNRNIDDLADELEDILIRSVADRLVSDVPVGAFLSGGVDSSTIVAIATKRLNRSIRTYSIGFAGAEDSEHAEAEAMARHLGTEHTTGMLTPEGMGEQAARMGAMLDEPNGDSSCMPTWHLARLARQDITVALSGDGGDELFGGYGRYFTTLAEAEQAEPGWNPGAAYFDSWRILLFAQRPMTALLGLVPPTLAEHVASLKAQLDSDTLPLMNRMRQVDAATYMPGAVLAKVDRMSMRHSLEVRAPLLGREVADFAATLAADECGGKDGGKRVLKAVARRFIPADWIDRPKRGFGLPMRGWAEQSALVDAEALFGHGDSQLARWLGDGAISRFLAAQRRQPMMYQIWEMMVLEHWLRSHPATPFNAPAGV